MINLGPVIIFIIWVTIVIPILLFMGLSSILMVFKIERPYRFYRKVLTRWNTKCIDWCGEMGDLPILRLQLDTNLKIIKIFKTPGFYNTKLGLALRNDESPRITRIYIRENDLEKMSEDLIYSCDSVVLSEYKAGMYRYIATFFHGNRKMGEIPMSSFLMSTRG